MMYWILPAGTPDPVLGFGSCPPRDTKRAIEPSPSFAPGPPPESPMMKVVVMPLARWVAKPTSPCLAVCGRGAKSCRYHHIGKSRRIDIGRGIELVAIRLAQGGHGHEIAGKLAVGLLVRLGWMGGIGNENVLPPIGMRITSIGEPIQPGIVRMIRVRRPIRIDRFEARLIGIGEVVCLPVNLRSTKFFSRLEINDHLKRSSAHRCVVARFKITTNRERRRDRRNDRRHRQPAGLAGVMGSELQNTALFSKTGRTFMGWTWLEERDRLHPTFAAYAKKNMGMDRWHENAASRRWPAARCCC
jgi:hypothetical protein